MELLIGVTMGLVLTVWVYFIKTKQIKIIQTMDQKTVDLLNQVNKDLQNKLDTFQNIGAILQQADDTFVEVYGHIKYDITGAIDLEAVKAECQKVLDLINTNWRGINI